MAPADDRQNGGVKGEGAARGADHSASNARVRYMSSSMLRPPHAALIRAKRCRWAQEVPNRYLHASSELSSDRTTSLPNRRVAKQVVSAAGTNELLSSGDMGTNITSARTKCQAALVIRRTTSVRAEPKAQSGQRL